MIGFLANPNMNEKLKSEDPDHVELLPHNECKKVLLKTHVGGNTHNRVTHYMSWDPDKHSTTYNPYRALDKIFVDVSVDIIMMSYEFEEGFNRINAYKDCKQKRISGYYSRSKAIGMYSVYA